MRKHLTTIILKTFAFSIPISMIGLYMLLDPIDPKKSDLQGLAYGLAIFVILVLSLTSATIYLNLLPRVRNSVGYSFLSFFALPFLSAVLVINSFGEVMGQLAIYSMMVMPFFLLLGFYYWRFSQRRSDSI